MKNKFKNNILLCIYNTKVYICLLVHLLQQIPKWWLWLYYMSPMSWTLNVFFTTQFGYEDHRKIDVFGETKSVASFVRDYFGFRRDLLPLAAIVLAAFPVFFATLFGYSISKLNFQRR
jgi:hypothetical protein